VDGEKAADSKATTTFVTDANVVATTVPNPSYTPRSLYMSASDNYMQEIKTFLQKPQLVFTTVLQSSDTVSSFNAFASSYPSFFSTVPMWAEKTRGFYGIRFDLSFRLVVNATRFQQGRYMLLWKPFGGSDAGAAKNLALMAGHVQTLVQRTQMPHAEIDINCDTEIEFKIPFSNMYNFCHIRSITTGNNFNSLGTIQLYPYVPLNAIAGALSCGVSLYVNAENIELISAAAPQMSSFAVSRRGRNETNAEQSDAGIGPISSVMAKVKAGTSILTGVPLISSYASTASWMADIIGRTAAVFGYSRPINLEHANRMTKEIFPYIANCDGPDNSFPLALSYKNELGSMTGISPTDLDEMDFTFLATIPVWDRNITWPVGSAAGTALSSWGVGPLGGTTFTTVVNGATLYHLAPYRFIAQHFKFWRGTMVYKIKIVKTEFHSGRLSFSYTPRTTNQVLATTPAVGDLPYLHREIVDIRIDNEVTFKVPFVSDTPWRRVEAIVDDAHITGIFAVHVVDPLVAPETVPQSIQLILEISMAPDVEFSVPIQFNYRTPFYGAAPQMGAFDGSSKPEANICNEITTNIGTSSALDDSNTSAFLCIGEKISSLRKYIRRASPFVKAIATAIGPQLNVVPFGIVGMSQAGVANTTPSVIPDVYSTFAAMYLYSRGSVRLKYVTCDALNSVPGDAAGTVGYFSPKFIYRLITESSIPGPANIIAWTAGGVAMTDRDVTQIQSVVSGDENQEFQIPHYHKMPLRNNFDHFMNSQYVYGTSTGPSTGAATELLVTRRLSEQANSTQDSVPTQLYRGTADDCNFSYFLSLPPVTAIISVP